MNSAAPRDWLPAAAAAVLAAALYAITLAGTYVYDDVKVIVEDPRVHQVSQWKNFWTQQYIENAVDHLYRPLVSQSYGLEWRLHGDRPWAFHLVNILLHAAAAAAVAELARRLFGYRTAIIAGLLFAAHPIHVEAVANIVGRAELMCTVAILAAMLVLVDRTLTAPGLTGRRVVAIVILAIIAMLCKEQGMLLVVLLPALVWATGRWPAVDPRERRNLQWVFVALAWSVAAIIILREEILKLSFEYNRADLDWTIQPLIQSHGIDRLLMPLVLLGRYTQLLLFPWRLSPDYGALVISPVADLRDPYLYLGIVAMATWLILLGIALIKRQRVLAFCLLGLALSYAMVSNIILIGTILGERLMYLPSVFFLILIAWMLARIPRRALIPLMMVVLIFASVRTVTYAHLWNDRMGLYSASLADEPRSIRLHMLVADTEQRNGDYVAAEKVLKEGRDLAPTYAAIWSFSATVAEKAGDLDTAEFCLRHIYAQEPIQPNFARIKAILDKKAARNVATKP